MITLLLIVLAIALFAFWIGMLVDCLKNERDNNKIAWLIVLILLPFIGTFLYYVMRFNRPPTLRT